MWPFNIAAKKREEEARRELARRARELKGATPATLFYQSMIDPMNIASPLSPLNPSGLYNTDSTNYSHPENSHRSCDTSYSHSSSDSHSISSCDYSSSSSSSSYDSGSSSSSSSSSSDW